MAITARLVILPLLALTSCQSVDDKIIAAAEAKGRAEARQEFPDLPPQCTAKMDRVKVKDEPWVMHTWRWNVSADNRDRQAADCAAWGAAMKRAGK